MITLEQIKEEQEKVNELVRKYEEQEQQKEKETYELEYPKEGEKVYHISRSGLVEEEEFDEYMYFSFVQGNIKFTEDEAELESKRRDLITKFNQFRDKCNGDWKPDFDDNTSKYFICLYPGKLKVGVNYSMTSYPKFGYFKNEEDCKKAIELFGKEIKELF